jgi:hypothetical protein
LGGIAGAVGLMLRRRAVSAARAGFEVSGLSKTHVY